jgi:hypothetical protein
MAFQQRLMIITVLAAALALPVVARRASETAHIRSHFGGQMAIWLLVVASALVVVGVVSQTLVRHAIQIAPLAIALGLLAFRPAWAVSAAAPLFAFWFLIMGAIWLFLLGIARILTGTFSTAEVTLTVIIGVASALGLGAAYRRGITGSMVVHLGTIGVFAILQFVALWLSTQSFVTR